MLRIITPPKQILGAAGRVAPGQTPALPSVRERERQRQTMVLAMAKKLEDQDLFIKRLLVMEAALRWKFHVDIKDAPAIFKEFVEATKARLEIEKMAKESPALKAVADSLPPADPPVAP